MKVTRNWLAEFVEMHLPLAALVDRLTMAGFEVDAVEPMGTELAGVTCAEIVRVSAHPHAPRLSLCDVRTGTGVVSVVCGAPDLRAGMRAPFAAAGTALPGGQQITRAEIQGVSSAGMLCSAAELGLGSDATGLLVLPRDAAVGAPLAAIFALDDVMLDVSVSPNRGDCLSVLGLAREIAALTGQPLFRQRRTLREAADAAADRIGIRIDDPDLCGRYVGRVIAGVDVGPAPLTMQYRLRAVGLRPINNVVDVTNYIMLERGQPLHAFDYDRLPHHEIVVRRAGELRTFTTLDGQPRELQPDDLMICSGEVPIAIAGVMGGADSEVTNATRTILLESAWFAPSSVRATARRLGLRTEASFRFERTVDIEGVPAAADAAAGQIARLAGGTVSAGRVDVYPAVYQPTPVALRLKRVDDVLGMSIARGEVIANLKALGMNVTPATRGTLSVVPPSYRSDLTREIDLIEEIVRLIGYEAVPTTFPSGALTEVADVGERRRLRDIKGFLAAQGLNEAVSWSFCTSRSNMLFPSLRAGRRAVEVVNPITQDDTEMRLSLCSTLVRGVRDNLRQGVENVALFSIGTVFWEAEGRGEGRHLAGAVAPGFPHRGLGRAKPAEFTDVKGVVEALLEFLGIRETHWLPAPDLPAFHPGRTAHIEVGGRRVGWLGAVHPALEAELEIDVRCWLFELDLEDLLQYCPRRVTFAELPRFPAVVRDLAVVADENFASDELIRFVRQWNGGSGLIEDVQLFDLYVGEPIPAGKKSLAYSISYRAPDRTLMDIEVGEMHAQLIAALKDTLNVEPR
jgi:phenylalanyl-tRNA synthetase beta chain